jgi:hypothetical protein
MSDARMRILFRRIKSISENATIQLDRSINQEDWEEVKRLFYHLEAIKHLAEEVIVHIKASQTPGTLRSYTLAVLVSLILTHVQ